MADVGFGVEPPARHFNLEHVPLVNERDFLLCRIAMLEAPAIRSVVAVLRDAFPSPSDRQ